MRLIGVGPAVRNALDQATPSECLLVYQASDWADDWPAEADRSLYRSASPGPTGAGSVGRPPPCQSEAAGGRYPGGSENYQGVTLQV